MRCSQRALLSRWLRYYARTSLVRPISFSSLYVSPSPHPAAIAPAAPVAELGVVRRFLAFPVNYNPEIQRLASRTTSLLLIPSWVGFIYTLLHRPHHVSVPVSASLPDIGFITVATLVCSLITLVCALPTLGDDISSLRAWFFTLICAVPFIGMLCLLDPAGAAPVSW